MFKIQNATGGILPLVLENGSGTALVAGQYIDLDRFCSRDWINNNPDLQYLLKGKHLRLVHDSTDTTDTKHVFTYMNAPTPPPRTSAPVHTPIPPRSAAIIPKAPMHTTNPKGSKSDSPSVIVIDLSKKAVLAPTVSTTSTVAVVQPVVTSTTTQPVVVTPSVPPEVLASAVASNTAEAVTTVEKKSAKKDSGYKNLKKKAKG